MKRQNLFRNCTNLLLGCDRIIRPSFSFDRLAAKIDLLLKENTAASWLASKEKESLERMDSCGFLRWCRIRRGRQSSIT